MIENVAKELGVNLDGNMSKSGSYVIDIEDSDEFGVVYSILDKNDDVEELQDNIIMSEHTTSVIYMYDDFQLNLTADYDADKYMLIVTEVGNRKQDND